MTPPFGISSCEPGRTRKAAPLCSVVAGVVAKTATSCIGTSLSAPLHPSITGGSSHRRLLLSPPSAAKALATKLQQLFFVAFLVCDQFGSLINLLSESIPAL